MLQRVEETLSRKLDERRGLFHSQGSGLKHSYPVQDHAVLNVEGKIFLAVVANIVTNFVMAIQYINTFSRREEFNECQDTSNIQVWYPTSF